ncbi:alpha/beta fold hydrolase [Actinoplanes sp. NPDC051859]|uniref:alpha/beta fold hydrolase n=1 Tax=Actinoplanes sp. NPDC051859 TaxID=3363909 RepID=UPI00379BD45C
MSVFLQPGAEPRVVFVSQLALGGAGWSVVAERLTCGAATVMYDRPGTGDAPPRPAPNPDLPPSAFADELARLLDEAGITQPVVVVGHSFGGNIVRLFAGRHPERVAGLVYLDCSVPRQRLWDGTTPILDGAESGTAIDLVLSEVEVLQAPSPAVPSVVVASEASNWNEDLPHPAVTDLWAVHQRILAGQVGGPLVTAVRASHQIPAEAPDLVAYCVDAVVRAAANGGVPVLTADEVARVGGRLEQSA